MEHTIREEDQEVKRPDFAVDHVAGWDLERRVVLTKEPGAEHYTVTALTDYEIDALRYSWEQIQIFAKYRKMMSPAEVQRWKDIAIKPHGS